MELVNVVKELSGWVDSSRGELEFYTATVKLKDRVLLATVGEYREGGFVHGHVYELDVSSKYGIVRLLEVKDHELVSTVIEFALGEICTERFLSEKF